MTFNISIVFFTSLFIISTITDGYKNRFNKAFLICLFLVCICIIGFRDPKYWIDTYAYYRSFIETTNTLSTFSFKDTPYGYSEQGYYLLCVIIKSFLDSTTFYFFVVGSLSLFFIYKLSKYSPFPILTLAIYIARFMLSRDMNQMRAGLAISMVVSAIYYVSYYKDRKNILIYILVCLLASEIHTSVFLALPLVILNRIKIQRKTIYIGIILSFFIAAYMENSIVNLISRSEFIQDLAKDYVEEGNEKAWSNDLFNPMIYFQVLLLFLYTALEKKISQISPFYYSIRNAYFFSTILLIILCQYGIVAGRTSTIFATYEILIIPLLFKVSPKKFRAIPYFLTYLLMLFFFIHNIPNTLK